MKTEATIRQDLQDVLDHDLMQQPMAKVNINAFVALTQIALKTKAETLASVLQEPLDKDSIPAYHEHETT